MSRQNVYHNNENELLLTKIDTLIQKSRETRNRITGRNAQRGGNMDQYVDLDTPIAPTRQRGGNMDQYVDLDTPIAPTKRANRQRGQQGGNMDQYVDLDTPIAPTKRANRQRGGNMDQYVDLDTPIAPTYQRGHVGGGDKDAINDIDLTEGDDTKNTGPKEEFQGVNQINDISKIDFGLDQADRVLSKFDMLGGGCGCGGDENYPIHSASCGSRSYNRQNRSRQNRNRQRGGSSNITADIDRAIGSADRLLKGF